MTLSYAALAEENAQLHSVVTGQSSEISRQRQRIEQLEAMLKEALHREYGASSEQVPPEQARLFDEVYEDDEIDEACERVQVAGHTCKRRKQPRLSEDLPHIDIIHDLDEADKVCAEHGCTLKPLGEEVSRKLHFKPAELHVERHIQKTYVCPECDGGIHTAPKPPSLIPKSMATPSLLAWVAVSKFCDALPLYRQSQIFARLGAELNRTTLANWMIAVGERIQPLVNLLWDRLQEQPVIHMDETPVQVLAEPGKAPQSKSFMWVSAAGPPGQGVALFHYDASRSGKVAQDLLADTECALMTDGYEGYNRLSQKITRLGCWAHARRYFVRAQRQQPKGKTGGADQALAWIGKLYQVERQLKDKTPSERRKIRQAKALPILNQLRKWLDKTQPRTAPTTPLGKAMGYLDKQWPRLIRYLEDGNYPIDNNRAENAIRPFVIGRKNYLFSQSVRGVNANANLYSLIETAKAHGLDPHAYLIQVFEKLPTAASVEDFEALLPGQVNHGDR